MASAKWQKIRRVLKGFGLFLVVWTLVAMVFPLLPLTSGRPSTGPFPCTAKWSMPRLTRRSRE